MTSIAIPNIPAAISIICMNLGGIVAAWAWVAARQELARSAAEVQRAAVVNHYLGHLQDIPGAPMLIQRLAHDLAGQAVPTDDLDDIRAAMVPMHLPAPDLTPAISATRWADGPVVLH